MTAISKKSVIRGSIRHGRRCDGIVKKGVENTIESVCRVGREGMRATNDEIIRIMLGS